MNDPSHPDAATLPSLLNSSHLGNFAILPPNHHNAILVDVMVHFNHMPYMCSLGDPVTGLSGITIIREPRHCHSRNHSVKREVPPAHDYYYKIKTHLPRTCAFCSSYNSPCVDLDFSPPRYPHKQLFYYIDVMSSGT